MERGYLEEAQTVCEVDRQQVYGHPYDNFEDISDTWTVLLRDKLNERITREDVIRMMISMKLCRDAVCFQDENYVDIAGYAHCMDAVKTHEDEEED